MPASKAPGTRLVADIGGTNSRLALYDPHGGALSSLRAYRNRDYRGFEDIVASWLEDLAEPLPRNCVLAVAAPPFDDRVTMLNIDWSFSLHAFKERFGFEQLRCLNDFEGNAYALPHLGADDLTVLHAGSAIAGGKLATVGPGTGLGGAILQWNGNVPFATACEPGHMGLTPATEQEVRLFQYLLPRHGEVYAELLLSGPGLLLLYQSLAAIEEREAAPLAPEEISARALASQCDLCESTLRTFCALLGSICGDFVLANGAYGGLYLAGGIVPDIVDLVKGSSFVQRFQHKGKMREHLARIPLYLITSQTTGLTGAAHAPLVAR